MFSLNILKDKKKGWYLNKYFLFKNVDNFFINLYLISI